MRKGFISKRLRSGRKIVEESIEKKIEIIKAENFEWIDVQNPDRRDIEELAEKYNFNTLNIEDL